MYGSDRVLILLTKSKGTFLFIFWYSMNCSIINFRRAFVFVDFLFISLTWLRVAIMNSLLKVNLFTLALKSPSTKTLSVPSGSFNSCKTFATVPYECKLSSLGLSTSEFLV